MTIHESKKGEFTISTDKDRLDIDVIHNFLSRESGWCLGISMERVKLSIENSLAIGIYEHHKLIGFARVISDFSTIAYLGDVFVLKEYRGLGLSKWLMQFIMECPDLQGLRRWILLTDTAPWLYKKYGFEPLNRPEVYMEKFNPNVYKDGVV
ncbi:GNAT family N-acetyltransferase [Fulvivirga sp. 29W222]|uniref:GNAT family N-acetyltransferase n=2 Tax=Fulvivirga marina TaxID=2494733 RepID=A0A937KF28_9BACT|nr:GNAT family N-acetyltransferase [Fulvivirga marina]MBL6447768.1 GNAT family N-acetyltransferase [Fulvivirga marina]